MSDLTIVVGLLILVIIAFACGRIPYSVIGVCIPVVLVATGVLSVGDAFAGYTNTAILLVTAMFVIGAGMMKTGIVELVTCFVSKNASKKKAVLLILIIAAAFLSVIGSSTSSVAILLPLVIVASEATKISRSKLLYPVAMAAATTVAATFLGQGAMNMQWNEVMMELGGEIPLTYTDFFLSRLPFVAAAMLYCFLVCPRLCPEIPNEEFNNTVQKSKDTGVIPKNIRILASIIVAATILAMIFLDSFGIMKMYLVAIIGAVLLVLSGVLSEKEAIGAINWTALLMAGGVLSLATAMTESGAADFVGSRLSVLLGGTRNQFVLAFVFFTVTFIMVQFMNNLACLSVFVPLMVSVCTSIGADPRAAVLLCACAGATGFLTPMSSAAMSIVAPEGKYAIRDLLKAGVPLGVLLILIATFIFPLMYPMY